METLPGSAYHDAARFDLERQLIFARSWSPIGFAHRLGKTGEYVAADLAGFPIFVVRDGEELRGFHNVCRHRAGPVVASDGGRAPALVCGYHAWSYDLRGRLLKARDFGEEVSDSSLFPIRVEVWRGVTFVNLAADGPSLEESIGEFDALCPPFDITSMAESRELHVEIAANWKTYADNYLEGYHIPIVHPRLAKEIDTTQYRVEVGDGWIRHTAPAHDGSATSGAWLWRFPNLAVNVYPDGLNIEWYLPLGPRRTRVSNHYFFATAGAAGNDESMALSAEVLEEDKAIVETVQRNLEAGVYTTGPLSPKHEAGVAAFQSWVGTALGAR